MAVIRVAVQFHSKTGVPEDDTLNHWHFVIGEIGTPLVADDAADAAGRVAAFYEGVPPSGVKNISNFLSGDLSRVLKPTVRVYHLTPNADPTKPWLAGSPVLQTTFAAFSPALNAQSLPREVAVVMTMHGDLTNVPQSIPGGVPGPAGDTRPAARRRGRLFLGPLNGDVLGQDANSNSRPSAEFRTAIAHRAKFMLNTNNNLPDAPTWVVLSQTEDAVYPVVGGWVDDAWDTQRRRGVDPTTRTNWSDTAPA